MARTAGAVHWLLRSMLIRSAGRGHVPESDVPAKTQLVFDTPAGRQHLAPGPDGIVLVGRSPDCDLQLEDDRVSRIHCCLVRGRSPDCYVVRDLGSLNGTAVNGRPVQHEAALGPGDELQIGLTVGRLIPAEAVEIPAAPDWLHKRGAVHRDLAPAKGIVFAEAPSRGTPPAGEQAAPPAPVPAAVTVPAAAGPVAPADPRRPEQRPKRAAQAAARAAKATPPVRSPSRRAAGGSTVLSDDWLDELTRMERTAAALESESELPTARERQRRTQPHVPAGTAPRFRAGARWNAVRQSLDLLWWAGIPVVAVETAAISALLLAAFLRLARDGLSVFIPFEHGGPQFTDLELVQIGVALASVAGAAIVVLYAAWKNAEELMLIVLGGTGAGLLFGVLAMSSAAAAEGLFRLAAGGLALCAIAGAAAFGLTAAALKGGNERIAGSAGAALLATCAILLWWPVRDGLADSAELTIPMATPEVAPQLIGASACAAVALLLFLAAVRPAVQSYGDEPTRRWFDGFLAYHITAGFVSTLLLALTNAGAASGWTSGAIGLVAIVTLVVDHTLFVQAVRFVRSML